MHLLHQHMNEPPPKIETLVKGVAPKLIELVGKLLDKEPSKRPSNMGEVRNETAQGEVGRSQGGHHPEAQEAVHRQEPFQVNEACR